MTDAPVIIKRTSRVQTEDEFTFVRELISADGDLQADSKRYAALQVYQTLPMPDEKVESWRRTNLNPLQRASYHLGEGEATGTNVPEALTRPLAGDEQDGQALVWPGGSKVTLKEEYARQGVLFGSLRDILCNHPEISEKLGSIVPAEDGKFAALNHIFAQDGVVLYIPAGIKIENPLHSILWAEGDKSAVFSHLLVWLEENAEATYVHEYASSGSVEEDIFHNGLVEIHAGTGAHLKFVELQSWGRGVWNINHERVEAEQDAQVEWILGAVGSRLTKTFTNFDMVAKGASIRVSGFYFADGTQHFDLDTQQNHLAENTTSDLLYKGAITDHAYTVWQGMIYVAPGSQKTDGYQANRNLVLSKTARADSIPGLEIKANDVRCTHGATVGKIDADQEFYLQSRGLLPVEAKRLIVEGFFQPVMDRIPFEGVKNRFFDAIQEKMNTIGY